MTGELNALSALDEVSSVLELTEEDFTPMSKCGIEFLSDFWQEKYLQEYIKNGGSKIKFVTGRQGSGNDCQDRKLQDSTVFGKRNLVA